MLFYGDSIFSGCDASSMYNRAPFMPYMHKLIEAELQNHTKGKVQVQATLSAIKEMAGWTIYACIILAGLMLVVPWPKRDISKDTREWYINY